MLMPEHRISSLDALLRDQQMDVDHLVTRTGIERKIIVAMIAQRYTPSSEQRQQVSRVLGVHREQIRWGHMAIVEQHVNGPV